jgi:hypothetical protein
MQLYNYRILKNHKLSLDNFSLISIDDKTILKIRQWRNKQINILRQSKKISIKDQEKYFKNEILPDTKIISPKNIILAFVKSDKLIGYGGLTNICWKSKRGELAFLLDNKYAGKVEDSEYFFPIFLKLTKILAFKILKLKNIWTETYSIRPQYIKQLELNHYLRTGIVKEKILIDNKYYDSYFHRLSSKKNSLL